MSSDSGLNEHKRLRKRLAVRALFVVATILWLLPTAVAEAQIPFPVVANGRWTTGSSPMLVCSAGFKAVDPFNFQGVSACAPLSGNSGSQVASDRPSATVTSPQVSSKSDNQPKPVSTSPPLPTCPDGTALAKSANRYVCIPTSTPVYIPYPGNGGGPTICSDGTTSHSSGRGTCSHHGGIA